MTGRTLGTRRRTFSAVRVVGVNLCAVLSYALFWAVFIPPAPWLISHMAYDRALPIGRLISAVLATGLFVASLARGTLREIVLCVPAVAVALFFGVVTLARIMSHYVAR